MTNLKKVIQSNQCLNTGSGLSETKLQYHNSDQVINQMDFTEFRRFKNILGGFSLMPVNPYQEGTIERSNFEFFRQSNEFETKGRWPNKNIFKRDEVSFVYKEYVNWNNKKDVIQVAVHLAKAPMLSKSDKQKIIAGLKSCIKLVGEMKCNLRSINRELNYLTD